MTAIRLFSPGPWPGLFFDDPPIIRSMLWVKALHIVFVASWFAGLFYLPRLFVNLAIGAGRQPCRARAAAADGAQAVPLLQPADGRRDRARPACCGWATASASGPGNDWLHAKLLLVVLRDRLPPRLPLAAAQVRAVRQPAQRALVSRLQRSRRCCCSPRSSCWSSSSRSDESR